MQRLLSAAVDGSPVAAFTAEEIERLDAVGAFMDLAVGDQWERLVALAPALAEIAGRAAAEGHRSAALAELPDAIGPDAAIEDIVGRSGYALRFASEYVRAAARGIDLGSEPPED
jgi:hypothetical protein